MIALNNGKIRISKNDSKRTYTIRMYDNGKCYAKYRTNKVCTLDFVSMLYWTENDWKSFLRTNEYYKIK